MLPAQTYQSQPKPKKYWKTIGLIVLFLTIVTAPLVFAKKNNASKSSPAFISPLSANQPQETVNDDDPVRVYQLNYYLSLANSFTQKATRLANDDPTQTQEDKLLIIHTLNEALKAANNAVRYYPNAPDAYLNRAQLYQKISHIYPEAKTMAQNDLARAQALMDDKTITLENTAATNTNPLDFIPIEKASLAQNITIAAPEEDKTKTSIQNQQTDTNALSGKGIVKAGNKEIIIPSAEIKNNDTVYVVPKQNPENKVLTVTAKKQGEWFKVDLDTPAGKDVEFDWWIIPGENQPENSSNQIVDYRGVSWNHRIIDYTEQSV